jgi:hypothetical protein
MPEATLATFDLGDLPPAALEQKRREIILSLTTTYRGYNDPDVPRELLQQLAVITATLRRRNAGPPKVPKKAKPTPKTAMDILSQL